MIKGLFLYALVPVALLVLFARPAGEAIRGSGAAAFLILLVVLGAVVLNWFAYQKVRRKRPSLLVFAHGILCLLASAVMEEESMPQTDPLTSTLAVIVGLLAMAYLLLLSFWFASRRSKAAHSAAVVIRVLLGIILVFMVFQVVRDIEIRKVTAETFLTGGFIIALILGRLAPRIYSACRRKTARKRANLAAGTIVQIVGETHLDLDDDPVTRNHARIRYTVDGVTYETKAELSRFTTRRFGREAFIGLEVPVFYDPDHPSKGTADRINRHILEQKEPDPS